MNQDENPRFTIFRLGQEVPQPHSGRSSCTCFLKFRIAGGHGQHTTASGSDTDPVCGMQVSADSGYAKAHQGILYRFCSKNCLDKFDADPQQYLKKGKGQS